MSATLDRRQALDRQMPSDVDPKTVSAWLVGIEHDEERQRHVFDFLNFW